MVIRKRYRRPRVYRRRRVCRRRIQRPIKGSGFTGERFFKIREVQKLSSAPTQDKYYNIFDNPNTAQNWNDLVDLFDSCYRGNLGARCIITIRLFLSPAPIEYFHTKIPMQLSFLILSMNDSPVQSTSKCWWEKNVTRTGFSQSPSAFPCQIIPPMFPDPTDDVLTQLI